MKFKNYIINETVTSTQNVEKTIVKLWNNEEVTGKKYLDWVDAAQKVVEHLKLQGLKGKAEEVGKKKLDTSEMWRKYKKAKSDTSKTDIKIGDEKISIKVGTAGILGSAREETLATFYSVVDSKGYDDLLREEISERIEGFAKGRTVLGTNPKKTTDETVKKIDKFHKETQEYMRNLFNNNIDFKMDFIHEAMSGKIKFGKNSIGSADWLLNLSHDGNYIKFEKIDNRSLLSSVANAVSISVRFKSTSVRTKTALPNERNYWSVLMMVHKMNVNESIGKSIKNLASSVKKYFKKGVDKIFKFVGVEPVIDIKGKI